MNCDVTGSWSAGTNRLKDLLNAHIEAAKAILDWHKEKGTVDSYEFEKAEREMDAIDFHRLRGQRYESETMKLDLERLTTLLSDLAPPGFYWGHHPDDEMNFGFWKTVP